jgi:hypothetical protein
MIDNFVILFSVFEIWLGNSQAGVVCSKLLAPISQWYCYIMLKLV